MHIIYFVALGCPHETSESVLNLSQSFYIRLNAAEDSDSSNFVVNIWNMVCSDDLLLDHNYCTHDERDLTGHNIGVSLARGMDSCEVVLLTRAYVPEVNAGCAWPREFNYAMFSRKRTFPVVLERELLDPSQWPKGLLPMTLSSCLFVDGCAGTEVFAQHISRRLVREGFSPSSHVAPPLQTRCANHACVHTFEAWGTSGVSHQ